MESPDVIRSTLAQCCCTERYWLAFPDNKDLNFTDGVKVMAEMCGAYWLIIAIFSWQVHEKVKDEPFQVWKLRFKDNVQSGDALLICEDGNNKELARQEIEYTDFPLEEGITLYLSTGVLMLPSEY